MQGGAVRLVDEVVVQGQELGLFVRRGLGNATANGAEQLPGEELLCWRDATSQPLQIASFGESRDQAKNGGARRQADHVAYLAHRREARLCFKTRWKVGRCAWSLILAPNVVRWA